MRYKIKYLCFLFLFSISFSDGDPVVKILSEIWKLDNYEVANSLSVAPNNLNYYEFTETTEMLLSEWMKTITLDASQFSYIFGGGYIDTSGRYICIYSDDQKYGLDCSTFASPVLCYIRFGSYQALKTINYEWVHQWFGRDIANYYGLIIYEKQYSIEDFIKPDTIKSIQEGVYFFDLITKPLYKLYQDNPKFPINSYIIKTAIEMAKNQNEKIEGHVGFIIVRETGDKKLVEGYHFSKSAKGLNKKDFIEYLRKSGKTFITLYTIPYRPILSINKPITLLPEPSNTYGTPIPDSENMITRCYKFKNNKEPILITNSMEVCESMMQNGFHYLKVRLLYSFLDPIEGYICLENDVGNLKIVRSVKGIPEGNSQPLYLLAVNTSNGVVNKSPDKTHYGSGEAVTLTACPDSNYRFSYWTGDISGETNSITIIMNSNKCINAIFITDTQIRDPNTPSLRPRNLRIVP